MWWVRNCTQRVPINGSLSGLEGCAEWACIGICLVLLLFSIFINDLAEGKERLLQTTPRWKCWKDPGEQEQEFRSILTNWKNAGNAMFFMEISVHVPICWSLLLLLKSQFYNHPDHLLELHLPPAQNRNMHYSSTMKWLWSCRQKSWVFKELRLQIISLIFDNFTFQVKIRLSRLYM